MILFINDRIRVRGNLYSGIFYPVIHFTAYIKIKKINEHQKSQHYLAIQT